MTGSMSGKEKHDAEHRQGSLPFGLDSCALLQSWRPQVVDLVAPINHDAILILAREYSRGYSSLSSHSVKSAVFASQHYNYVQKQCSMIRYIPVIINIASCKPEPTLSLSLQNFESLMGPVRIRHSSHDFGWQSSHSVDLAGWQAKMASIEIWIP